MKPLPPPFWPPSPRSFNRNLARCCGDYKVQPRPLKQEVILEFFFEDNGAPLSSGAATWPIPQKRGASREKQDEICVAECHVGSGVVSLLIPVNQKRVGKRRKFKAKGERVTESAVVQCGTGGWSPGALRASAPLGPAGTLCGAAHDVSQLRLTRYRASITDLTGTMGLTLSSVFGRLFGNQERRILMGRSRCRSGSPSSLPPWPFVQH